jgi:hypothetical protein
MPFLGEVNLYIDFLWQWTSWKGLIWHLWSLSLYRTSQIKWNLKNLRFESHRKYPFSIPFYLSK